MPDDFKHAFLKQRREFLQLSCLDIAKLLFAQHVDISDDTVRNWEVGQTTPDADYLPALATVLKCKVQEFYE